MAITYQFPTSAEVKAIGPLKIARNSESRLGFQLMPMRSVNAAFVEWTQKDNYFGLQQLRGLGGAPSYVKPIGNKRYRYEPGQFGEFEVIEEAELTLKAGEFIDGTINMGLNVMERQDQLVQRELDRIEYLIWQVLVAGTFSITAPNGTVFTDTFTLQTYSATDWSNAAAGAPLKDFRTVKSTKGVGKGINFGAQAIAVMNSITAQYFYDNTNTADVAGKLVNGGSTLNVMPGDIEKVMVAQDLPKIVTYDEGYYDDSNTFQYYVPTDKVIVIGKRGDGQPIGEYIKTRHMIDGGGTGSWMFAKDYVNGVNAPKEVPSRYELHAGHAGGPVLYLPSSIVVMSV